MRVLLSLGNAELFLASFCHRFTHGHGDRFGRKNRGAVVVFVVFRKSIKGDFGDLSGLKLFERSSAQKDLGKLAGTVSPEIEKDNDVSIVDPLLFMIEENNWREKLIGFFHAILFRDGFAR